jgi:hypothetical protein
MSFTASAEFVALQIEFETRARLGKQSYLDELLKTESSKLRRKLWMRVKWELGGCIQQLVTGIETKQEGKTAMKERERERERENLL